MTKYREIIRLFHQGISQRNIALSCSCSRNTVAKVLAQAHKENIHWPLPPDMSDIALEKELFPERGQVPIQPMPEYEKIHKEMAKSGVTLTLLWQEYCESCRLHKQIPYMYTQFCKYYHEYVHTTKATMYMEHKPGEKMELDWAGKRARIFDSITGEEIPAYLFVACLPCSQYGYAEAFLRMDQESWTAAHVHALEYFGGTARIWIIDNLKTGVTKHTPTDIVLNRTYQELAEHYGAAIIPCKIRAPKEKASVEGLVGKLTTWILASLRDQVFFTTSELNQEIHKKLNEFNEKPFQKKEGSRKSVFFEQEKHMLMPLPDSRYEMAVWKLAVVQYNYCISVDHAQYSVPYEYIKHSVDVRLTTNTVEIFFQGLRLCSHLRLYGLRGQYSIKEEHMPTHHKQYAQWTGERFRSWAQKVGINTQTLVEVFLKRHKVEQQGYKSCMALLKLQDTYTPERLEKACEIALTYTSAPSFKSVQTILKTGRDQQASQKTKAPASYQNDHGFTRGADYYGGKE